MKIALIQGSLSPDRPTDNLEHLKTALGRPEMESVALVVLPPLALTGPLGPTGLTRPGLAAQLKKVLADFLEISSHHQALTIVTSAYVFEGDKAAVEKSLVVKAGQIFTPQDFYGGSGCGESACPGPALYKLGALEVAVTSAPVPVGLADRVDLLISLHNHIFQGEPFRPAPASPAKAWRINVSTVGGQGPYIFEGATTVVAPGGALKGWAHGFEGATVLVDTDSKALPDFYPLPKRDHLAVLREALVVGLRDFIRSSGDEGQVLLGLSGGLDSALVAALAVEALGPEKVLGVAMPSEFNAPESLSLARELAKNLGISFLTVPIDGVRESFTRSFLLTPKRDEKSGHLADENIQARIRGILLMYLANREGRLVLTTGNKSEAAMGYSTLYGDTCGAIAPLGDVYKSRVFDLARLINKEREIIPEEIITRPPSAELRPDQKDEDSLPPYAILDNILALHLEGGMSGSQVARDGKHSPMTVAWVLSSIKKAAFKRSQTPFCLQVSSRPLTGLDWTTFDWPRQ